MGKHKEKLKKHKKEKKKHKRKERKYSSNSDSSSTDDEWIEKPQKRNASVESKLERNDWLTLPSNLFTKSQDERRKEKETDKRQQRLDEQYNPSKNTRELNPYWKDGGDGLPTFKKPDNDGEYKKKERRYSRSSDSSGSDDESRNEKPQKQTTNVDSKMEREDWLTLPSSLFSKSQDDRRKDRETAKRQQRLDEQYNPSKNTRELNPYWKDGGDGLPKFKKPDSDANKQKEYKSNKQYTRTSGWKKKPESTSTSTSTTTTEKIQEIFTNIPEAMDEDIEDEPVLSEKEMNALAAKVIKAEIMGNTKLATDLKNKLEAARKRKNSQPDDAILLTRTDAKGYSVPIKQQADYEHYDHKKKSKKQKIETHSTDGERVRYFADDDKYSLKQMFENEKFSSVDDQNSEFLKLASGVRKNDDLADVFTDKIRKETSSAKLDQKNRDRAVNEQQRIAKSVDNCTRCLQSDNFSKHLMIATENSFYLSLPGHEPLTDGHCLLTPIKHVVSATQLDENEWDDFMTLRRQLTRLFLENDGDCIFFEIATGFYRFPHMHIECVPVPKEMGDLAPIYFKKAIDESETEWATNKKLVSLAGRNVQKAIPKGLPYFSVSFGMDEGYAHVIEDEQCFPRNFAQEIIGGMLDLHHSKWRKPRQEKFDQQSKRVTEFNKLWMTYNKK